MNPGSIPNYLATVCMPPPNAFHEPGHFLVQYAEGEPLNDDHVIRVEEDGSGWCGPRSSKLRSLQEERSRFNAKVWSDPIPVSKEWAEGFLARQGAKLYGGMAGCSWQFHRPHRAAWISGEIDVMHFIADGAALGVEIPYWHQPSWDRAAAAIDKHLGALFALAHALARKRELTFAEARAIADAAPVIPHRRRHLIEWLSVPQHRGQSAA